MSHFFKSKNNQHKNYVYLLVDKPVSENNDKILVKIIITNGLILHDMSYITINYDKVIENENNKIIEHLILTYNFKEKILDYPYDMFYINRVLLYSFLYLCNNIKFVKNLIFKEKINFISNNNYLKRIKDWNFNWKKNRFSIEKYQMLTSEINSESIFSMLKLSECYFNINDNNDNTFDCVPISYEEKSLFERNSERPNTDLIEKCYLHFEDEKLIKFL